MGKLDEAIRDCDHSLKLQITPEALDSRGFTYLKKDKLELAIADYDLALALDPKHALSLYGRGLAKLRKGDEDSGKRDIDAAKGYDPKIADTFSQYGLVP